MYRPSFPIVSALLLLLLGMTGTTAYAVPTLCSAGSPHPDGLSTSDVQFDGTNATDCYGVLSGNPTAADADAAWQSLYGGGAFNDVGIKSEGSFGSGSYGGLDFYLGAENVNDGKFLLAWACNGNCPAVFDVVFGLKASNSSALYLFDDLVFQNEYNIAGGVGVGKGEFEIAFVNGGGQFPALSNMTMFLRDGTVPVPEPGTLSLLGIGLLGVGLTRRRRGSRASA